MSETEAIGKALGWTYEHDTKMWLTDGGNFACWNEDLKSAVQTLLNSQAQEIERLRDQGNAIVEEVTGLIEAADAERNAPNIASGRSYVCYKYDLLKMCEVWRELTQPDKTGE